MTADAWWADLDRMLEESLIAAGPRPTVKRVHLVPVPIWEWPPVPPEGLPPGQHAIPLSLCERGDHGGTRPAPHGWDMFTDRADKVTCGDCEGWLHA